MRRKGFRTTGGMCVRTGDVLMLDGKSVLVTGGTGTFGKAFIKRLLTKHKPRKVIVYSRDEYKQYGMQKDLSEYPEQMRYFLGDVRDKSRLCRAFEGVDYVIHAAALKQVPALEYNPTEAVKTNVVGADNIVNASMDTGIKKVIAISTDKAVNPINLYGATKLVSEKIFIAANAFSGGKVKFSSVRYGNVMGSRGSVIPLFMKLRKEGVKEFTITDERMTRFWITIDECVDLIIRALGESVGQEIFVPRIPSMKIVDLARAIAPDCGLRFTGIRPGEKLHESLISRDEAREVKVYDGLYVILPQFSENKGIMEKYGACPSVPEGFEFRSDTNDSWMSTEQLGEMLGNIQIELD
jgi:UDP-N-acetylglucosamine 4,6-dehydratase